MKRKVWYNVEDNIIALEGVYCFFYDVNCYDICWDLVKIERVVIGAYDYHNWICIGEINE